MVSKLWSDVLRNFSHKQTNKSIFHYFLVIFCNKYIQLWQKKSLLVFQFLILIDLLRLAIVERKTFINELSRTQLNSNAKQHKN